MKSNHSYPIAKKKSLVVCLKHSLQKERGQIVARVVDSEFMTEKPDPKFDVAESKAVQRLTSSCSASNAPIKSAKGSRNGCAWFCI